MELVIGAAGLVLSALMFVAGERRADKRNARDRERQQEEIAVEFVALAKPLVMELRGKIDHLDRVRRGTGDLYDYFKNEIPILPVEDAATLRAVVQRGGQLDLDCANAWRSALTFLVRIHEDHQKWVNLAVVGDLPENIGDGEAYRRGLQEADAALMHAMGTAVPYCAAETRSQIESLQRSRRNGLV